MKIKRRPRKIYRIPKESLKKGCVLESKYFPYKLLMYIIKWGIPYNLYSNNKMYYLNILGKAKYKREKHFNRKPRSYSSCEPIYNNGVKPKDKDPVLYKQYKQLRECFINKGRPLHVYCEYDMHQVSLETCFCRCDKECSSLRPRWLVGEDDGLYSYMNDFMKLQRLVNLLYGTVRKRDIEPTNQ